MTDSPFERLFRERLAEAVRDLVADGWEVLPAIRWAAPAVPGGFVALQPDLVRKGSELLVGGIKARRSENLRTSTPWPVPWPSCPNARFEVYWLGDEATEPGLGRIRELAAEARTLAATGHLAAAVVIAWAALERGTGALHRGRGPHCH